MRSQPRGQISQFLLLDVQHAVFRHQGVKLLLFVRHAMRQGRNVPVNVRVALITTKAEDIHTLGWNRRPQGFRHAVDNGLKLEIGFQAEICRDLGDVLFGCNQAIPVQHDVFGKKDNRGLGFEDDVVRVRGIALHNLADEARPGANASHIRLEIEWVTCLVRHALGMGWLQRKNNDCTFARTSAGFNPCPKNRASVQISNCNRALLRLPRVPSRVPELPTNPIT